jgi:hypothetical protein
MSVTTPIVPAPGPKMKVGLNYPWYGNKYGDHLLEPKMAGDFSSFAADAKSFGVETLRVFLLCDLNQYGTTAWGVNNVHFTPDASRVSALVAGLEGLLKALKTNGSKAILSLVDFYAFNTAPSGSAGKYELITNGFFQNKFFDEVFEPMLKASAAYRDQIYAWEIMNEPRWADADRKWSTFSKYTSRLTHKEVVGFLDSGLKRIAKHELPSTVGHAFAEDMANYPTGTIRQFHYYANDGSPMWAPTPLPPFGSSAAILGEISGRDAAGGSDADEQPWMELKGKDKKGVRVAVFERLKHAHKSGYSLAMLWPRFIDANDFMGTFKFSADAKHGIRDYNTWVPP